MIGASRWPKVPWSAALPPSLGSVLAGGLCIAVIGLVMVSYRSIDQWRKSSELLANERAEVMLTLFMSALNADMKGAQVSVLLPLEIEDLVAEPPYDLRDAFAAAFGRYPYVESFFLLRRTGDGVTTLDSFDRPDRLPSWDAQAGLTQTYPVVHRRNPAGSKSLSATLLAHARDAGRFTVFETLLAGTQYQVVAKLLRDSPAGTLRAAVGFTVGEVWVREHYYRELVTEVTRIGDATGAIALVVKDARGQTVVQTRPLITTGPTPERRFLPLFFDTAMLSTLAPAAGRVEPWRVGVSGAGDDQMLVTARIGARGAYGMLTAAAVVSVAGMLLTMGALRRQARLIAMQSDFVCAVTHELKTPVSFIRLLGETLSKGRYNSLETVHDYARILSQEAWRLTRLIDNILTFARVTEGRHAAHEPIEVAEMLEEVLSHFRPQLIERQFTVEVNVTPESIRIIGDRTMVTQAVDNLVANAIKYSNGRGVVSIRATLERDWTHLTVTDRGIGISAEDLPRVFDKFFRGKTLDTGGSGLGLAIVKRVVEDHGGKAYITSDVGQGTSVHLVLPAESSS